jgi:hypothetical protein
MIAIAGLNGKVAAAQHSDEIADLSTAFCAVGVHTPPEQLMFCVGSFEMTTSARAPVAASTNAKAALQRKIRPDSMSPPGVRSWAVYHDHQPEILAAARSRRASSC